MVKGYLRSLLSEFYISYVGFTWLLSSYVRVKILHLVTTHFKWSFSSVNLV